MTSATPLSLPMVVLPLNENPPLQFSILRLAIALSVFGIPFAFFADKGESRILLSILVGSALACISLVVARRDRHRVVDLILFASIVALACMLFVPAAIDGGYCRTPQVVDSVYRAIAGALVGSFLGWLWNLATKAN
jgi:predicted membrane channel-forming protein YqfA (hemolysin III family)